MHSLAVNPPFSIAPIGLAVMSPAGPQGMCQTCTTSATSLTASQHSPLLMPIMYFGVGAMPVQVYTNPSTPYPVWPQAFVGQCSKQASKRSVKLQTEWQNTQSNAADVAAANEAATGAKSSLKSKEQLKRNLQKSSEDGSNESSSLASSCVKSDELFSSELPLSSDSGGDDGAQLRKTLREPPWQVLIAVFCRLHVTITHLCMIAFYQDGGRQLFRRRCI